MSLWDALKYYINDHIGEVITRHDIITHLIDYGWSIPRRTNSTMDTYRNYLTQAGYLSKFRLGSYRVDKEIPVFISIQDVKTQAYGDRYIPGRPIISRELSDIIDVISSLNKNSKPSYTSKSKDFISEKEMKI